MPKSPLQRTIAYIDGFNLYYGLRDHRLHRFYWLNVQALAKNLLQNNQQLIFTKYFTARIAGSRTGDHPRKAKALEAKRKRQSNFLEALKTLPDFQLYEGHYLSKDIECRQCNSRWRTHEEKMTDVQIATQMLADAFKDQFDTALLISADSDLVPPTLTIREVFPEKRVVVAFPPGRSSVSLDHASNASLIIGRGKLKESQFPGEVKKADGYVLQRPSRWQ